MKLVKQNKMLLLNLEKAFLRSNFFDEENATIYSTFLSLFIYIYLYLAFVFSFFFYLFFLASQETFVGIKSLRSYTEREF